MKPKFRVWGNIGKEFIDYCDVRMELTTGRIYAGDMNYPDATIDITDGVVLMQSTGLFDKNGVEIFAGDILRLTLKDYAELKKPYIFTVSSDEEYYGDVLYLQNINYHINQDDTRDSIEIIGNIYENPELLEVRNASK